MKLSEAKRRIVVGSIIDAVGHYNPSCTGPRTVTKVQTNGFAFSCERHPRAWCYWPKASLTRSLGPDSIQLLTDDGQPLSTLTLRAEWPS